ncbi:MAG: PorT family protein [Paludibacteraceae bacterium]|nr:PorT family protein [Paludibacteraceae bacterium]
MKKKFLALALALTHGSVMLASVEDAKPVATDSIANEVVAIDSSIAKVDSMAPVMTELKVEPELPDTVIDENNDTTTLVANKKLPEIREVTIGVSVGGGMGWYSSTPTNNKNRFAFRGGLNFDIPFGQWFSLNPEMLIATRGGGYKMEYASQREYKQEPHDENTPHKKHSMQYTETLWYIDVPINCKFSTRMNFSRKVTGRPFVSVGPSLCFGLYAKGEGKGLGTDYPEETSSYKPFQNVSPASDKSGKGDATSESFYSNFDFGANFRIGYDFDAGYSIAIGYQLGFLNIVNDNKWENADKAHYERYQCGTDYPSVRNNSFYITFGWNWF